MSGPVPDISILIVAYNSAAFINACLRSIPAAARQVGYEVLLIDNGDGSTEELVARDFPDVRIVQSQGNIGFAKGNNLLANHAKADKLLLLNPDMELCEGAIDALVEGSKIHRNASAWGAITLTSDGRPDSGNSIAIPSLAEFASLALGRSIAGSGAIKGLVEDETVATLSGSCVLIDRAAWQAAGGLDESYFLYCEEVDLFYRLGRQGHSFWRISGARGLHRSGHGEATSPVRLLYKTAGTVQFLREHWAAPARMLGIVLIWIAAIERHCAGMLLGRWKPHLARMGEAYRLVARRPHLWAGGYHESRGLLARLPHTKGIA